MTIPFVDCQAMHAGIRKELTAAYERVIKSGWYILGKEAEAFEEEFAGYCGARYCAGTGNGLDALYLILCAYGIGAGDEVIVPANTFVATWLAVSRTGATPVPVEPDARTLNINAGLIEKSVTEKTRAVIAVHLYGQPADMDPILDIARRSNLIVIEDAAQAHGARYKGKRAGALADAAAFSFYPTKNLGALGDAGAVVTDNDRVIRQVRLLRNYGCGTKHRCEKQGINSRLDALQAAFLRVKLKHLDAWNARRLETAMKYRDGLSGVDEIAILSVPEGIVSSWHLFVIRHRERDALQAYLKQLGIETLIHYPVPPHFQKGYQSLPYRGRLPLTERTAEEILSLPIGPHLQEKQAAQVIHAIKQWADR